MPEYLAPGVYVEETSFRSKSIEGVSTTTTGFIGPTRYGPIDLEPEIVTSLGEFERTYGDRQQLEFQDNIGTDLPPMHNWMWHAVRAFFEEGGKRLYIARTFRPRSANDDGRADATIGSGVNAIKIEARFPGEPGNMRVRLTLRPGQNLLGVADPIEFQTDPQSPRTFRGLAPWDVVWISDVTSPIGSPPGSGALFIAEPDVDPTTKEPTWKFTRPGTTLTPAQLTPSIDPHQPGDQVRVVTLTVTTMPSDPNGFPSVWEGLPLDPRHKLSGQPDSFAAKFAEFPSNLSQARTLPIVITPDSSLDTGVDILDVFLQHQSSLEAALGDHESTDAQRSIDLDLKNGNDGTRPEASDYEGEARPDSTRKNGLKLFEDLDDISIVAAPGSTFGYDNGYGPNASSIINLLISHATRMRYRIAVLDSGDGQSISQVRALRAKIDSTYAALYYPWVRILDPVTRLEIYAPPSGFVAGIYARNDVNRAVYKAPANEVVNLSIGFEQLLNKAQQEVLNPEGVNCFRFFEGRGFRLWGARTISSDPEWKYVNLRRYFAYLEHSIDKGTQWAVFEPNGEALWANVRRTIEDFLLNEWQSGALLGDKPEKAYFVKCDRSTMTQNDLDNGRLICLIGVAPLRPAEFVIFRIGQWTADRKT
jgi:phage tail sheath protein FI